MKRRIKYFFKNLKSRKRLKVFGPHAKGIIFESENGLISLPIGDTTIGKGLGFKGQWDIKEINKIIDICDDTDVIYVIGTHVGTLLIPLAKKVKQIVGYEANENTYNYMQMNLRLNQVNNATLYNYAVGDEKKEVMFYQNKVNTGGSKIMPIKDSILYNYDNPNKVLVQMIVLDNHANEQQLPQPDGFIMDIEGAEYFALKGMQKSLSKVKFLYVEYVPHHLENVSNVSNEDFLNLITPHFNKATFLKKNTIISFQKGTSELLNYLNNLQEKGNAEDILFER